MKFIFNKWIRKVLKPALTYFGIFIIHNSAFIVEKVSQINIHLDTTILILHQNTLKHAIWLREMTSLHVFCIQLQPLLQWMQSIHPAQKKTLITTLYSALSGFTTFCVLLTAAISIMLWLLKELLGCARKRLWLLHLNPSVLDHFTLHLICIHVQTVKETIYSYPTCLISWWTVPLRLSSTSGMEAILASLNIGCWNMWQCFENMEFLVESKTRHQPWKIQCSI
jgi:hypothetical protein